MNKTKAFFVTVIVAGMLALILFGAYRMSTNVFTAATWVLAAMGYVCGANLFRKWLERETPMLPAGAHQEAQLWEADDEWTGDYDAIKAEMESEG